jgi:hypothetical protein
MSKELKRWFFDLEEFVIIAIKLFLMGYLIIVYIVRTITFAFQFYDLGIMTTRLEHKMALTVTVATILTIIVKKACDYKIDDLHDMRHIFLGEY